MKRFILKCGNAICICTSTNNDEWFWSENYDKRFDDKRFIVDFDTKKEAQSFIDEQEMVEASECMGMPMPRIVEREEFIIADKLQLKLDL